MLANIGLYGVASILTFLVLGTLLSFALKYIFQLFVGREKIVPVRTPYFSVKPYYIIGFALSLLFGIFSLVDFWGFLGGAIEFVLFTVAFFALSWRLLNTNWLNIIKSYLVLIAGFMLLVILVVTVLWLVL